MPKKNPLRTCHTPQGHPLGTPRNVMPQAQLLHSGVAWACLAPLLLRGCPVGTLPMSKDTPPPPPRVTDGALGAYGALNRSSSCSLSPLRAQTAFPRPDRGQMSICSVHHFSFCIKSAFSPTPTERPWASYFAEINSSGTVYELTRYAQRNVDLILSHG